MPGVCLEICSCLLLALPGLLLELILGQEAGPILLGLAVFIHPARHGFTTHLWDGFMSALIMQTATGFGIRHSTPGGGPSHRSSRIFITIRWVGAIGISQETLACIMIIQPKPGLLLNLKFIF